VGALLVVMGRGHRETGEDNITQRKELYQQIEDRIEG
jgi:hypothetical protein